MERIDDDGAAGGLGVDLDGRGEGVRDERGADTEASVRSIHRETIAVELATLPDEAPGYESTKLANVDRYEQRRDELLTRLATA